jgi:uncharacterized repeat protein (TIGR03843 family)
VAERADVGESVLSVLRDGPLEVVGRLVEASNATLFCRIDAGAQSCPVVYKPIAGERPLWDFPVGTLAYREVAAYLVSEATGWRIVPPTVIRDGPFGPGMCQLWIDTDETIDQYELSQSRHPQLRRMAVFDAVVNNADRKGSHLLPTADGHVYGVDHGVCFSAEDKLRTVLWQWRGQPLPDDAAEVLTVLVDDLAADLGAELTELLSPREVAMTRRRAARLLRTGRHPQPSHDWPPLPWPPF